MATHSSILARRIPGTGEAGCLLGERLSYSPSFLPSLASPWAVSGPLRVQLEFGNSPCLSELSQVRVPSAAPSA